MKQSEYGSVNYSVIQLFYVLNTSLKKISLCGDANINLHCQIKNLKIHDLDLFFCHRPGIGRGEDLGKVKASNFCTNRSLTLHSMMRKMVMIIFVAGDISLKNFPGNF